MDRNQILIDLQGNVCSGCGNKKSKMQSFCRKCYYSLSQPMRQALYKRFFEGYEEAFEAALKFLKGNK